jgi:hypothetical protein
MRKKTFFILLAVLGLLYLASLGAGIVRQPEAPAGDRERQQATQQDAARSAAGNPVLGAIDWLLAPFAPPLLLQDARCAGQPVAKTFRLGAGKGCMIALPNPDKDYRRGRLVVETDKVALRVFAPRGDAGPNGPIACTRAPQSARPTLCVAYAEGTPPAATAANSRPGTWLERPTADGYRVSVQPPAGTLFLACAGCETGGRTISLRLH